MARLNEWTMRTEFRSSVRINRVLGNVPEYRRGGSFRLELLFLEREVDPANTGGEYNYAEYGRLVWSGSGLIEGKEAYKRVRQYGDYSGAVAFGTDINGIPWYREQIPEKADTRSLVVAMVPKAGIVEKTTGFWALILDITDVTSPPMNRFALDVEFGVLGELDEYNDFGAIRSELEK